MIRWGILSTANIAQTKLIPAIKQSGIGTVSAIASRRLQIAEEVANRMQIPQAYGNYEELLADRNIDAIYNPLPNDMHVDWTIKALEAGKHVLCEKPLACNSEDLKRLQVAIDRFPELKVMEAFMYRSHPQWGHVHELLLSGAIGNIRSVHTQFTYNRDEPEDYRNKPESGGGGLLDVGCYGISVARWMFGEQPVRVCTSLEIDKSYGVDKLFHGLMEFANGGVATVLAGTQCEPGQALFICGDKGSIRVTKPFYHDDDGVDSSVELTCDRQMSKKTFNGENHYCHMVENFARAINAGEKLSISMQDTLDNMRTIDAFFDSAKRSAWISL